jgi:hypothetical protein
MQPQEEIKISKIWLPAHAWADNLYMVIANTIHHIF